MPVAVSAAFASEVSTEGPTVNDIDRYLTVIICIRYISQLSLFTYVSCLDYELKHNNKISPIAKTMVC